MTNTWDKKEKEATIREGVIDRMEEKFMTFNQHDRHLIEQNLKLTRKIAEEVNKQKRWPDRLSTAQSVLYYAVKSCLEESNGIEREKKRIKLSVLAQVARIIATIDAYPDEVEEFRESSHDELQNYLNGPYQEGLK